jgi:hypothetical protein
MEIGHPTTNALSIRMISRNADPVAKRRKYSSECARRHSAARVRREVAVIFWFVRVNWDLGPWPSL